jgi:ubiquinone/menaquinone biosynthesis C-methylase UbiE
MSLSTENEIQQYYSTGKVAADYVQNRFVSEVHRLLHEHQVAAVQRAFDQVRPACALEIAPGPGRITRAVRPTGKLFCLEFNEGMIQEGVRACTPEKIWLRGNGFQLPFAEEFDLVYTFRFIRHFHHSDRDRLYAQVRRVLRPGGLFLMDAVNEAISRPLREAHPEEYPVYDKLYNPQELRDELTRAGFEVVALEPVQKFYGLQQWSQVFLGPRSTFLNRCVVRFLERLPRQQGLEWVVTCRRA